MTVAIFAREPIPGKAKTRLAAAIGPEAAAELYAAFVRDTIEHCRAIDAIEIHVADPDEPHPFLASLGAPLVPQVSDPDLGVRMAHALRRASIVVGTDAPTLRPSIPLAARALLARERAELVLAPAADGGYVLIATDHDASFLAKSSIRWSSEHALADTIRAARSVGRTIALTAPHYDIDTVEDLRLLRAHLGLDPHAAPYTARVVASRSLEILDF